MMIDVLIGVPDEDPTLPPAGCRSGAGSSSVLPYLVKTLSAKPKDESGAESSRPVAASATSAKSGSRERPE
jgi:hypothetical protein